MSVSFSVLAEFSGEDILPLSRVPLVQHPPPHLGEGEVSVGEEVSHLPVLVIHVVEQVPLDGVLVEVSTFRKNITILGEDFIRSFLLAERASCDDFREISLTALCPGCRIGSS